MNVSDFNRPSNKAVPQTRSVIIRILLAAAVGLAVLVAGVLRIIDIGQVTWSSAIMPLVGVFLLALAALSARDLPAARALDARGAVVPGKIVGKWTRTDADNDRQCYVAYEFQQESGAIQKVGWKHYREVQVGDEVTVRYLPEDPSRSRLEGEWYR